MPVTAEPQFPAASTKRGMARAIECVEWVKAFAEFQEREYRTKGNDLVARTWQAQAFSYDTVLNMLRDEESAGK